MPLIREQRNSHPLGSRTVLLALVVVASPSLCNAAEPRTTAGIPIRSKSELPPVLAGEKFQRRLQTPLAGATWEEVPLRVVLRALGKTSKLSIVRDRRLDPRQPVTLTVQQQSQIGVLRAIAHEVGAEVSVLGNVVYLGPPESARLLRTLAAIKSAKRPPVPLRRRQKTIQWPDLTQTRQILATLGRKFGFTIANPQVIPYDLWEGATLPQASAAEALTLVLIQFDLTFSWKQQGQAIQLIPLPKTPRSIAIKHAYRIPANKRKEFLAWRKEHRGVQVRQVRGRLMVRGLAEAHESLRRLLHGNPPPRMTDDSAPQVAPLKRRRFTLTVKGVPAKAIIRQLKTSGITIEYDAAALEAAGIDFATPVTIDVKNAPPSDFLSALFDPLGLDFEFSATKVRLRPKE